MSVAVRPHEEATTCPCAPMAYDALDETRSVQLGVSRTVTRSLLGVSLDKSEVDLEYRSTIQAVNSPTRDKVLMNVLATIGARTPHEMTHDVYLLASLIEIVVHRDCSIFVRNFVSGESSVDDGSADQHDCSEIELCDKQQDTTNNAINAKLGCVRSVQSKERIQKSPPECSDNRARSRLSDGHRNSREKVE